MSKPFPSVTKAVKRRVLKYLATNPNVSAASLKAGCNRRTVFKWRQEDPEFARAFDDAIDQALDKIEGALFERAVNGTMEYVVSGGRVMADSNGQPLIIRKYSDTAAIAMLKARRRDVFGDKSSVEMSGPNGKPIEVESPSDRIQSRIAGLAAGMAAQRDSE